MKRNRQGKKANPNGFNQHEMNEKEYGEYDDEYDEEDDQEHTHTRTNSNSQDPHGQGNL